jgi:hypothetical protein
MLLSRSTESDRFRTFLEVDYDIMTYPMEDIRLLL